MSGFDAILEQMAERAALRTVAATRDELRDLVRSEVRAILDERDADQTGGLAKLATWIGAPSSDACRKRVERDPAIAGLAIETAGGQRRWRRSEVLALLSTRKAGR
jgi:hypothetical protein